jgi:hypothetical protein
LPLRLTLVGWHCPSGIEHRGVALGHFLADAHAHGAARTHAHALAAHHGFHLLALLGRQAGHLLLHLPHLRLHVLAVDDLLEGLDLPQAGFHVAGEGGGGEEGQGQGGNEFFHGNLLWRTERVDGRLGHGRIIAWAFCQRWRRKTAWKRGHGRPGTSIIGSAARLRGRLGCLLIPPAEVPDCHRGAA